MINFLFSIQALLNDRFNTIFASGANLPAAQTFQNLVLTASNDSLDSGMYATIKPFYAPLTPTFQLKVKELNDAITDGMKCENFAMYVKLLAATLLAA